MTGKGAENRVDAQDVEDNYVEANGFTLHYKAMGDGPSIVLLHGDSASAFDWYRVLPQLARDTRVYALDLPGHGDSSKPDAPYSPSLFSDTLVAFLDALDIDRAVFVGHSLGGLVAVQTALRFAGRVQGLCLVASGGLGRYVHPAIAVQTLPGLGEAAGALAQTAAGSYQRAWARAMLLFARWWAVPPGWIQEQRRLAMLPGFADASLRTRRSAIDVFGQKELILPELGELQLPTLVVWGASDIVVPVSHGLAAAGALPKASLEVLPGCGHMPHLESPAALLRAVTALLDEVASVGPVGSANRSR